MRHQKVREREEDKKLLREGLSRKSETKRGGRAARDRRVGQTVWSLMRLLAPQDMMMVMMISIIYTFQFICQCQTETNSF